MGTILVLAVLVLIVAFIIRGMIRDKKNGKSVLCGGSCASCGGHCHQMRQYEAKTHDGGQRNG